MKSNTRNGKGCAAHNHIMKLGERGLIYNGDIYSFPDRRMRDKVLREIAVVEQNSNLYAEMDLKARLYRFSKGKLEHLVD
ncbi:MAG: hypothetical protein ACPL1Y_07115 [Thermoplasmata archaeon]